ncbi:DoxX family protein [Vibrio algarum]|uniref:DoxX family protein n=1 Tax=Vibrio algarum TaxID=3020714 RepID=A0ABT4YS13_9VIBR|nr:DoxX family protein [Vibrio sp. KJ40-1]MDB1124270.1 DoxX family protein [Vibrio sp. KJ40-1]
MKIDQLLNHVLKPSNLGLTELVIRVVVSFAMMYHGYGKLTGIEQYTAMFTKIGIEPAGFMVVLAGLSEMLGGLALFLGCFTRFGAISLSICMIYAFIYLGLPKGYNIVKGGYEYQLAMMSVFLFFIVNGAGKYSLDNLFYKKRTAISEQ